MINQQEENYQSISKDYKILLKHKNDLEGLDSKLRIKIDKKDSIMI